MTIGDFNHGDDNRQDQILMGSISEAQQIDKLDSIYSEILHMQELYYTDRVVDFESSRSFQRSCIRWSSSESKKYPISGLVSVTSGGVLTGYNGCNQWVRANVLLDGGRNHSLIVLTFAKFSSQSALGRGTIRFEVAGGPICEETSKFMF